MLPAGWFVIGGNNGTALNAFGVWSGSEYSPALQPVCPGHMLLEWICDAISQNEPLKALTQISIVLSYHPYTEMHH